MGLIYMLYGVASYAAFFIVFLYMIGFTGNYVIPGIIDKTVDGGQIAGIDPIAGPAWLINAVLILLFGLHHTITARPGFKKKLTSFFPAAIERSTYVLVSSLLLVLLFAYWVPMTGTVWAASGVVATGLEALYWIGIVVILLATFMIDHFDLFGLRQVWLNFKGQPMADKPFTTRFMYSIVRHPILLGWLIFFWATPVMTTGHLLYAGGMSVYILIAVIYEERDLVAHFGDTYRDYQKKVPQLIPFLKFGK